MTDSASATAFTAYHGDAALKRAMIAQMENHATHDRLVKGQYWQEGRGCAIGCTIQSADHAQYEPRFGLPVMLARLEDAIFEGLPDADAIAWPVRFMAAAPIGADLSLVGWQLLERMLRRALTQIDADPATDAVHTACAPALDLISRKARDEVVSADEARDAARTARAPRTADSAVWRSASAWCAECAGEVATLVGWQTSVRAALYVTRCATGAAASAHAGCDDDAAKEAEFLR